MPEVVTEAPEGGIKGSELKREIDKKAEKIRAQSTLPKSPGKEITDREWEPWAKLLTESMWEAIVCYLYRRRPKIIRQLSNPTNSNYIDKIVKITDIREYIKQVHGGGNYQMKVVQSGIKDAAICNVNIDISIDEAMPILNFAELDLNAPENVGYKGYLINKGIIDDKGKQQVQQNNGGGNQAITGSDMVQMFDKFLKLTSEQQMQMMLALKQQPANDGISSKVGDILLAQMQQNDPNKVLTSIAAMKDLFKQPVSTDNGVNSVLPMFLQMFTQMMTMQEANHKSTLELIKEMKQGKGDDTLGSLEKAASIMEMMNNLRGDSGPRSGWDVALDIGKEIGIPVIQSIMQLYSISRGAPAPGQPTAAANPGKSNVQPINGKQITTGELARQRAAEAATQKPAMMQPEVVQPEVVEEKEVDPISQQLQMLLQSAGGMIVEFMKQGRDGVDLAENVVSLYSKMVHAQISSNGEERLFNEIKAFPELWAQLSIYGEEKVKLFVHEFVHFEELLMNDPNYQVEADDEDEIEVPVKKGKGKK